MPTVPLLPAWEIWRNRSLLSGPNRNRLACARSGATSCAARGSEAGGRAERVSAQPGASKRAPARAAPMAAGGVSDRASWKWGLIMASWVMAPHGRRAPRIDLGEAESPARLGPAGPARGLPPHDPSAVVGRRLHGHLFPRQHRLQGILRVGTVAPESAAVAQDPIPV